MQALILAGGKGTRLRPLTMHTPKPVVPIVNRPFLLYQIDLLKRAGITDITLSLSYQPGRIEELLGDGGEYGVRLHYTVEASPLGTAGAYKNAAAHLKEPTVVLNGDTLTSLDLGDVIACHHEKSAVATIVLVPVDNPSAYGLVETDPHGRVLAFREKPKPEEIRHNTINAGIYVLDPHILDLVPADEPFSFEYQLFPSLLERGEAFYAYVWHGYWLDIGTPHRYLQANLDIIDKRFDGPRPERLPGSLHGSDFESAQVDEMSVVDRSCDIRPGVEINRSVIGPNCIIEDRARIEGSVLWAGARVGQSALIRNSVVGRSGIVGRNAVVENAILGDKSSLTDYTMV